MCIDDRHTNHDALKYCNIEWYSKYNSGTSPEHACVLSFLGEGPYPLMHFFGLTDAVFEGRCWPKFRTNKISLMWTIRFWDTPIENWVLGRCHCSVWFVWVHHLSTGTYIYIYLWLATHVSDLFNKYTWWNWKPYTRIFHWRCSFQRTILHPTWINDHFTLLLN